MNKWTTNCKTLKQSRLKLNNCIFLKCRYYITNYNLSSLGIIKIKPSCQQLYYNDEIMDGEKTLIECGLDFNFAKPHTPAIIGLALK